MKTQNKNFLYNAIYQIFMFIIPMITIPYVSRILGVDNVGIYSYTYSIVYYFMLFSMLGISNYGSREIAKCHNQMEINTTFKSIYLLQLTLNVVCLGLYFFSIILLNYEYKNIMIIQTIFLISVAFDINWFFFGKEKFKVTVTRNVIIKFLSLILIFIFVRSETDLWIYTLIMGVSTLLSQIYLWLFLGKEVQNVKVGIKSIVRHLKPCLILFIPVISYSIYRVMDKTMIGSLANTIELGNYESAEKIINIPGSFVAALGTVMLPHMSKKSLEEIKRSIYETFELTFFIITPMIIGLFIVARDFSDLFFGSGYDKAGILIRILAITILFSSVANVIRTNFLIPLKKDKVYVISTVIGAIVNLVCNVLLIKSYGAYGACVGTILAEFLLMFYQVINTKNDIDYRKVLTILFKYFCKSVIIGILIFIFGYFINNIMLKLILQIAITIILYILLNYKYIKYDFLGKKE